MKLFLMIFLISGILIGKNLQIRSRESISNIELLDVYIHTVQEIPIAIIPGGLGGTNFVDISNPSALNVLGEYFAFGCDWARIYAWSAKDYVAYGSGRKCGIHVVNINDVSHPTHLSTIVGTSNDGSIIRYEHTSVYENLLLASRHQNGVEIFNIENPESPQTISTIETDNAWATTADNHFLYIADGGFGIKIFDITDPSSPFQVSEIVTTGTAKDVEKRGDFLFVAVGAAGVDMIDVSEPVDPFFVSNYNTTGYASRISVNDSLVAVSDWDDVEVLEYSKGELELTGYKSTGGRVMALAMMGKIIYSAEWLRMSVFEYGEIQQADIDLSTRKIEYPRTENGFTSISHIQIENNGLSPLNISGIYINSADFSHNPIELTLQPKTSQSMVVNYSPSGNVWIANLEFLSNDHDENQTRVRLLGNFPMGPMPGDHAPNFTLPVVNGTDNLSLNDLNGNPAVIAFFTGW
ncbi:MAG: hypothetical protein ACE5D0_05865 [Fidelibacterota bacterium]